MTDNIGFDATNRTITCRITMSRPSWLIAIGIGWAIVIGFAAIVAKVTS